MTTPTVEEYGEQFRAELDEILANHGFHTDDTCDACRGLPGAVLGWMAKIAVKVANEQRTAKDERPQDERDADVRAVARALRELRINNPGVMALKAVTRLEQRYADRIAKLPKPAPIQGSGYTPLQLLGVVDERDDNGGDLR